MSEDKNVLCPQVLSISHLFLKDLGFSEKIHAFMHDKTFNTINSIQRLQHQSPQIARRKKVEIGKQHPKKIQKYQAAQKDIAYQIKSLFDGIVLTFFEDNNIFNQTVLDKSEKESVRQYSQRLKSLRSFTTQLEVTLLESIRTMRDNFDILMHFYERAMEIEYNNDESLQKAKMLRQKLNDFIINFSAFKKKVSIKIKDLKIWRLTPSIIQKNFIEAIHFSIMEFYTTLPSQSNINVVDFLEDIYYQNHPQKIKPHTINDDSLDEILNYVTYTPLENIRFKNTEEKDKISEFKTACETLVLMQKIVNDPFTKTSLKEKTSMLNSVYKEVSQKYKNEQNLHLKAFYQANLNILTKTSGQINQLLYLDCSDQKVCSSNLFCDIPLLYKKSDISSVDDLCPALFTPNFILLSQGRPSFFNWASQNLYDENQTLNELFSLLIDTDKIVQARDFSAIEKITKQSRPAWWKWWRQEEYHRYLDMEYNAKLIFVLQAFCNGCIHEQCLIDNIHTLAENHPHQTSGKIFESICQHISMRYQQITAKTSEKAPIANPYTDITSKLPPVADKTPSPIIQKNMPVNPIPFPLKPRLSASAPPKINSESSSFRINA